MLLFMLVFNFSSLTGVPSKLRKKGILNLLFCSLKIIPFLFFSFFIFEKKLKFSFFGFKQIFLHSKFFSQIGQFHKNFLIS